LTGCSEHRQAAGGSAKAPIPDKSLFFLRATADAAMNSHHQQINEKVLEMPTGTVRRWFSEKKFARHY
jgi:hypothetical protein